MGECLGVLIKVPPFSSLFQGSRRNRLACLLVVLQP